MICRCPKKPWSSAIGKGGALAMFRSGDVLQRRESAYELDRAIDSLRCPTGSSAA